VLRGSGESAAMRVPTAKERGESDHPDAMRVRRDSWEGDVHLQRMKGVVQCLVRFYAYPDPPEAERWGWGTFKRQKT